MIKAVIFDLDNTLYNFDAANEYGLAALAAYTEPVFGWDYAKVESLYAESRLKITSRMGDVASAHNRLIRFQNLLEDMQLPIHPHALQMAKSYWKGVLDNMTPIPGAKEIFEELRRMDLRIGLGTDMTSYVQYEKMGRLGFMDYMDFIVTSEEAGTDKPGKAFFALCAQKAGCLPSECLFIGDNIVRDYGGASEIGMQARWFIPPWKQKNAARLSGSGESSVREISPTGSSEALAASRHKPLREKNHALAQFLSLADGIFPEQASKDLSPAFAEAMQDPQAPESRGILDAVPRIFSLDEIPGIIQRQNTSVSDPDSRQ